MFDIYQTSANNSSRFVIGEAGTRPIHVIALNPSTADQNKSDTTITKIRNFSTKNNYSGFMVYNLYPQRSTSPDNLHRRYNKGISSCNCKYIFDYISESKQPDVWVAWGQMITKRKYLKDCLRDIVDSLAPINPNWMSIGSTTKDGHPRHPSRISYNNDFIPFNMVRYLDKLNKSR